MGSADRRKKVVPVVLLLAALGCLVLAFTGFSLNREASQGTVILTMDVSDSMKRTDVEPNRIGAAEAAARAFLQQLPEGFRVGIVTFAGDARILAPPTSDRDEVARFLESLSTSPTKGTKIGDGLSAALDTLEADWEQNGTDPGAVVLLSDGRDTGSKVSPEQSADRAKLLGALVFTVVLGSVEPAGGGGANAQLLQEIAETTDGQTFTAESAGELKQVYEKLGSQLSSELAVSSFSIPFLIAAGVLALIAGVMVVNAADR